MKNQFETLMRKKNEDQYTISSNYQKYFSKKKEEVT